MRSAAKYGKEYETPNGLNEDDYYKMIYDLVDYIQKKGLTTRQAQILLTDCADMILDVKHGSISDVKQNELSDADKTAEKFKLIKKLRNIIDVIHLFY